jgi:hypothetical protein
MTTKERKEYSKKYYLKNKEKLNKRHKEWKLKNADKNKEINKAWYELNKDHVKETSFDPIKKEKHNYNQRKYNKSYKRKASIILRRSGGYFVYYLPEEHYCGITNDLYNRESGHRNTAGKNTDNMQVLFHSMDRSIAAHNEAMFQSVLGINGLNYIK